MSTSEARAVFDQVIQQEPNADKRAELQICREYFTNPFVPKSAGRGAVSPRSTVGFIKEVS